MPRIVVYVIPVVFVVLQLFVYDFFLRTSFFFVYHLHIHVHLFSRLRPPPFKTTSSPPIVRTHLQLHVNVYISLHFSFLSPMYFIRVVKPTVSFSCWTCCNLEPVVVCSCILAVTLFLVRWTGRRASCQHTFCCSYAANRSRLGLDWILWTPETPW